MPRTSASSPDTLEGAKAPKFNLDSDSGQSIKLSDFADRWLVLYFYPKDDTPGCTREAQAFTDTATRARLKKLGADVVGVSKDSVDSHCRFRDKYGLKFPLLSDPDLDAHKAYGAYGTKTMYGKKVQGVIRSTFLIDPAGKIAKVWKGVKVDGHADKVVEALSALQSPKAKAPSSKAKA